MTISVLALAVGLFVSALVGYLSGKWIAFRSARRAIEDVVGRWEAEC